ncbi:MAG: hypothetical protein Fur0023_07100 [Bacteroidia bacterium]
MKKILLYTLIVYFIFCLNPAFSQNRINDIGMRISLKTKYELNNRQEITGMMRIRQYENFTELYSWRVDLGYGYRILSSLKISLHYAYTSSRAIENYFRTLHRYYIRTDYKKFINKYLTLYNRIILQHTQHFFLNADNGYKPYYRTDFRERIGWSYNLSSSANVYLHNEWMFTLSDTPVDFRRNRLYIGYEKEFKSSLSAKFYFILQSTFHKRKSPDRDFYIFGMDINFNI